MGARTLRTAALSALAGVTAMLLLASCTGPRVAASDVRVTRSARPGMYRVEATLRNRGGKGQVTAKVRLRAGAAAREAGVYTAEQPIDVERDDQVRLVVDVPAPAGDYTATVSIDYPPE